MERGVGRGECPKPQYRGKKNRQNPQYRIENRWNTETAFGNVKLFFLPQAASRYIVRELP